jgi:hypothetical protein
MTLYKDQALPISPSVVESHQIAFDLFTKAGTWFTGEQRLSVLREARHASQCTLCQKRKNALSPFTVTGEHDVQEWLPGNIIDVIHRLINDSGRLTENWFSATIDSGMLMEEYVEIVGLVATLIVLDSFATGLGAALVSEGDSQPGETTCTKNENVFDGGAWVPLFDLPQEDTNLGLPTSPNILRAMGLVPSAIEQFFGVMRAHYGLSDMDVGINRAQTELIAARVSALNQCFY